MIKRDNPIISVVIPTYNRKEALARAVSSVVAQSWAQWELIVVDDGSTDNTEEALWPFSDPRILYVRHTENRGGSAARNSGISRARGEYVAFLDSDDEWFPEKLAEDVAAFSRPGVGLVYCGKELVDPDGRVLLRRIPSLEGELYRQLLAHDFIGSCSRVAVRRDILEAIGGFDENLPARQDWDLWVRAAKLGKVGCVRKCLVRRHLGHEQISGSLKRICDGHAKVVEKYYKEFDAAALSRHWASLAAMRMNYDMPGGRKIAMASLRLRPLQPRVYASLAASLLGRESYRWLFRKYAGWRHGLYAGRAAT